MEKVAISGMNVQRNKNKKTSRSNPNHRAKAAEENIECGDDTEEIFKATIGSGGQCGKWIVDSGASCHMTNRRELMSNLVTFSTPEKVSLGDGNMIDAVGCGDVKLQMFIHDEGKFSTLSNVLLVPDLKCSLFSVRAAAARGKSVRFNGRECWIENSAGEKLAEAAIEGKLYLLKCHQSTEAASVAEIGIDQWHKRLGHMSEQRIHEMVNKKMVKGINVGKTESLRFCEACVKGKTSKQKFSTVGEKCSKRKLELIHSDVCGPMQTNSYGGKRYFITFIDDFTNCSAVYFMAQKSEALEKFQEFELAVTAETGLKIGALRTDNGGEYVSRKFREFLKLKGITHELTIPETPQQNGKAERMNRTLVESARSMLMQSGLPTMFWAEAISAASYLRNRIPTASINDMTPYEAWYDRKPDLSNARVFGCVAYAWWLTRKGRNSTPKLKR